MISIVKGKAEFSTGILTKCFFTPIAVKLTGNTLHCIGYNSLGFRVILFADQ